MRKGARRGRTRAFLEETAGRELTHDVDIAATRLAVHAHVARPVLAHRYLFLGNAARHGHPSRVHGRETGRVYLGVPLRGAKLARKGAGHEQARY